MTNNHVTNFGAQRVFLEELELLCKWIVWAEQHPNNIREANRGFVHSLNLKIDEFSQNFIELMRGGKQRVSVIRLMNVIKDQRAKATKGSKLERVIEWLADNECRIISEALVKENDKQIQFNIEPVTNWSSRELASHCGRSTMNNIEESIAESERAIENLTKKLPFLSTNPNTEQLPSVVAPQTSRASFLNVQQSAPQLHASKQQLNKTNSSLANPMNASITAPHPSYFFQNNTPLEGRFNWPPIPDTSAIGYKTPIKEKSSTHEPKVTNEGKGTFNPIGYRMPEFDDWKKARYGGQQMETVSDEESLVELTRNTQNPTKSNNQIEPIPRKISTEPVLNPGVVPAVHSVPSSTLNIPGGVLKAPVIPGVPGDLPKAPPDQTELYKFLMSQQAAAHQTEINRLHELMESNKILQRQQQEQIDKLMATQLQLAELAAKNQKARVSFSEPLSNWAPDQDNYREPEYTNYRDSERGSYSTDYESSTDDERMPIRHSNRQLTQMTQMASQPTIDKLKDRNDDVVAWFKYFEKVAMAFGWNEADKVSQIPLYLIGEAEECWDQLSRHEKSSYTSVKRWLKKNLRSATSSELTSEFFSMKQEECESARSCATRMQRLLKSLPTLKRSYTERHIIKHFVNCLKPEVAQILVSNVFHTLDDAISAAERIEKQQRKTRLEFSNAISTVENGSILKKSVGFRNPGDLQQSSGAQQTNGFNNTYTNQQQQVGQQQKYYPNGPKHCLECEATDHSVLRCPQVDRNWTCNFCYGLGKPNRGHREKGCLRKYCREVLGYSYASEAGKDQTLKNEAVQGSQAMPQEH